MRREKAVVHSGGIPVFCYARTLQPYKIHYTCSLGGCSAYTTATGSLVSDRDTAASSARETQRGSATKQPCFPGKLVY